MLPLASTSGTRKHATSSLVGSGPPGQDADTHINCSKYHAFQLSIEQLFPRNHNTIHWPFLSQREFEGIADQFQNSSNIRLLLKYDDALSHMIFAASDMFIVPSMFEPCGLTQVWFLHI